MINNAGKKRRQESLKMKQQSFLQATLKTSNLSSNMKISREEFSKNRKYI